MKKVFLMSFLFLVSCAAGKDLDWSGDRQRNFALNSCKNLNVEDSDKSWGSPWHKCLTKYGGIAWEIEKSYIREKFDKHSGDYVSFQEYMLQKEANEKSDIQMTFSYTDKENNTVSRNNQNSFFKEFWGAVSYVLHEHGREILEAAIDAKYGTSSTVQAPRMYCVSQRVGKSKIVHTHCRQR